ncbi:MAG: hypothetical protein Q8R83_05205 [Legionellaceae bacterium]|nr:hypothetical protein [Legionellaceae bacterium]
MNKLKTKTHMKWFIPAKTFLVGEYVALFGGPAIVLTTTPCFEITLYEQDGLQGIHPESPAGKWWIKQNIQFHGLSWFDPYQGLGGMGASSAQFLGAYLASAYFKKNAITQESILKAYIESAWQGQGIAPSGYDVLAQNLHGCVYINQQQNISHTYSWPFQNLAFILLRTGNKLATHNHLNNLKQIEGIDKLAVISESAHQAFCSVNEQRLIDTVKAYYQQLLAMHLVTDETANAIHLLQQQQDIFAAKGCGALGADVLLILVSASNLEQKKRQFNSDGWDIIATSEQISV